LERRTDRIGSKGVAVQVISGVKSEMEESGRYDFLELHKAKKRKGKGRIRDPILQEARNSSE